MRILTVKQPWAWAIIHGGKDVENRSRNIAGSYRGPVAIHAGLGFDADATSENDALRHAMATKDDLSWIARGAIIGVVDLADVHYTTDCYQQSISTAIRLFHEDRPAYDALPVTSHAGSIIGRAKLCSPWAMDDHYHLVLSNPRAINPIPYRGGLGLRRITDPDVIERLGL